MKLGIRREGFSNKLGFVLAAAGSAVGLGNIWRFPYLTAKYGGGIFLLTYLILVMSFGYALLISEIGIGRMTRRGPIGSFRKLCSRHKSFLGTVRIGGTDTAQLIQRQPENCPLLLCHRRMGHQICGGSGRQSGFLFSQGCDGGFRWESHDRFGGLFSEFRHLLAGVADLFPAVSRDHGRRSGRRGLKRH